MARFIYNWFRLLRVPNLFTAPGDSLAGLLLATLLTAAEPPSPRAIALTAAASFLAYAFGILTNDIFDIKEDRKFRPERPLPSGVISVPSAVIAAIVTAIGGTACAVAILPRAIGFYLLLLALIMLYNGTAKRWRFIGSVVMGLCRCRA